MDIFKRGNLAKRARFPRWTTQVKSWARRKGGNDMGKQRKFEVHARDRRRMLRAKAEQGRGNSRVAAIRMMRERGEEESEFIAERRKSMGVPTGLRSWVRTLAIKRNMELVMVDRGLAGERYKSSVLEIGFREPVVGIKGLPVPRGKESKLARLFYTHVTIERLPEGMMFEVNKRARVPGDSPLFRLTFWGPRGGHCDQRDKLGERVWCVVGDVVVLNWLIENGLRELYESDVSSFLPPNTTQVVTRAGVMTVPRKQDFSFV